MGVGVSVANVMIGNDCADENAHWRGTLFCEKAWDILNSSVLISTWHRGVAGLR